MRNIIIGVIVLLLVGLGLYAVYSFWNINEKLMGIEKGMQITREYIELQQQQESIQKLVSGLPSPPEGFVTVKLDYTYQRITNVRAEARKLKKEDEKVFATYIYKKDELPIPIADEVFKDQILYVKPGETLTFVYVVHNDDNADKFFYVTPHQYNPKIFGVAMPHKCWCMGETYDLPAFGGFARVVDLTVDSTVQPGSKVIITHDIIGTKKK